MAILPGHGLLLKVFFANGDECKSPRPFLVINVNNNIIKALNISSVTGKLAKLSMPSNQILHKNFPPFNLPSFVKLDELYHFEIFEGIENSVLCEGQAFDEDEFSVILQKHRNYNSSYSNKCQSVQISKQEILDRNSNLHIKKKESS